MRADYLYMQIDYLDTLRAKHSDGEFSIQIEFPEN